MSFPDIAAALGDFGPTGLFVAYLVWREVRDEDKRAKRQEAVIESNLEIARALAILNERIAHVR